MPTSPITRTGRVVPGGLDLGDARADPALVLLAVLHVGRADRARAVQARCSTYEKLLDETGREMHGSWGNMIDAEEAFARMGADVMRWQYCAQPPSQNLLFGFGPGHEIKRKLLTLWNSVVVLRAVREHRGLHASVRGSCGRSGGRAASARPLARRPRRGARRGGDGGVRLVSDGERDPRLRGVRRRPFELVHPPLAPPLLGRRSRRRCERSGSRSCRRCA